MSKKILISSTTIIASLIFMVILFIVIYNSYIYPMLHQDKLQLTQDLFISYKENVKKSKNFNIVLNFKKYQILIELNNLCNEEVQLKIKFFCNSKEIYNIDEIIKSNDISIINDKFKIEHNYNDILKINYNYIFNRFNIQISDNNITYKGRFKINCSNSPFISNTPKFKIFRKLIIDKNYSYDNLYGINESSYIDFDNSKIKLGGGAMFNVISSEFLDEYLLLNVINNDWILLFIITKTLKNKYRCYILIKNQESEEILYCGFLNKKLKFFHSVSIELNIGSSVEELKFKFYSESLIIDFNTNNIIKNYIENNKLITSIDLNIKSNRETYKANEKIYLHSNLELSNYKDILLKI